MEARRIIIDSQRERLSGSGIAPMEPKDLFDLIKQTKVGNIPTCPTCLKCYSSPEVLELHLRSSECSTLKWFHAPRLIKGRNKHYLCPYCSEYSKQERRAVMNHYNTDPTCRRQLLADINMLDHYLARYDFDRAKVIRTGALTPLSTTPTQGRHISVQTHQSLNSPISAAPSLRYRKTGSARYATSDARRPMNSPPTFKWRRTSHI